MQAPGLFEANGGSIDRAIARVCRNAALDPTAAEDFASSVRLSLLENDCAILQQFEGRSSMETYLTIVVRRLLIDARRGEGRWYASNEAQRRGAVAIRLECLLVRDSRPFAEAVQIVRAEHPEVTARELEELAAALPQRAPRPVWVVVGDDDAEQFAGNDTAADLVDALDVARRSRQANDVVRRAMAAMTTDDRLILRLRFTTGTSIASIARALRLEQRPLYRRIEALLTSLRRALEGAGIDAASAEELIGTAEETLDFGLAWKSGGMHPSIGEEGR